MSRESYSNGTGCDFTSSDQTDAPAGGIAGPITLKVVLSINCDTLSAASFSGGLSICALHAFFAPGAFLPSMLTSLSLYPIVASSPA